MRNSSNRLRPRAGASVLLWAVLVTAIGMGPRAHAAAVTLVASTNEHGAALTLLWPREVECRTEIRPRELLLRFNLPLESDRIDALPRLLSPWLLSAQQGYDSLLLVTPRDSVFQVHHVGSVVRISWRSAPPEAPSDPLPRIEPQAPLPDVVEGRIREILATAEGGRRREAVAALDRLRADHPADAQIPAAMAGLEAASGYWRRADALYATAIELQPDDADLRTDRAEALTERSSRAGADTSFSSGGQRTETRIRVGGQRLFPDGRAAGLTTGVWVEDAHLDADLLQDENGRLTSFTGDRLRSCLFARYDTEAGPWARVEGQAAASGPGLRLEGARPDDHGETSLAGDYALPYWELAEGLAGDATRDRVEFRRRQRDADLWTAEIAGAWNRYGIGDWSEAATSLTLEGSLSVQFDAAPLSIGLNYDLDAEFAQSVIEAPLPPAPVPSDAASSPSRSPASVTDNAPDTYRPLDIQDREVHSLRAMVGLPLRPAWGVEVSIGGAWDRETGTSSPCLGGYLTYRKMPWLGQIGFERQRDYVDTRDDISSGNASLAYVF